MRRFATILSVSLALGGLAYADDTDPAGKQPVSGHEMTNTPSVDQKAELQKQLSLVDVYLTQAIANTKALSTLAQQSQTGKSDSSLIEEIHGNIDTSVNKALKHVSSIKSMKANKENVSGTEDKSMGVGGVQQQQPGQADLAKVDDLEKQLKDVQSASSKITGSKMSAIQPNLDTLSSSLMTADQTFRDIASAASYTRIDSQKLNEMPVRGTDQNLNQDLNKQDLNKDLNKKKDLNNTTPSPTPAPSPSEMNPNLPPSGQNPKTY